MYSLIGGYSTHVLGHHVRQVGKATYVHRLHGRLVRGMCGTGAGPYKRILVAYGPPVLASGWLCQHHRSRQVQWFTEHEVHGTDFAFAGAGVIADIAAPAERGSFFGIWNIGPMVGPSLGPVLGGVLADKLGWR